MEQGLFYGYDQDDRERIQVVEEAGMKKVLLNGRLYMSWQLDDEASQRIAIAQIYELGSVPQQKIAKAFGVHVNSVSNFIQAFKTKGVKGLVGQKRGPKGNSRLLLRLRSKILAIALREGVFKLEVIQKRLEGWGEHVSLSSIRNVLLENGLISENNIRADVEVKQGDLFETEGERQFYLNFDCEARLGETVTEAEMKETNYEDKEDVIDNLCSEFETRGRRYYSSAQREYLGQLEKGEYNAYAGGLLFAPLLEKFSFLPTLKRVINIDTHEGYGFEELCLTLFYFDVFGFRSMEDFKRAYPEEFGVLVGRQYSPSLFTLRRFLHKVRELELGEELIDEFGVQYLKSGAARWGVLYIDGHFMPYYGIYRITKGWHGVRKIPMKGSYNFLGVDEWFSPWIFLVRSSSENLLDKIPEMIEKARRIGEKAGLSTEVLENLIVIFDREGYSAKLFRYLDGKDRGGKRRAIFITWSKYSDKWVNDIPEDEFEKTVGVTYEIRDPEEIKYFQTERTMNKYGRIRTIVIQSGRDKKRAAICTNGKEEEIDADRVVKLICRRWGHENLIKELLMKHMINYTPGYVTERMETQPMVDNPEVKELKKQKASMKVELHKLKIQLADNMLKKGQGDADWEEARKCAPEILEKIVCKDSEILLLDQEIDKLPEQVRFDQAHDGKRLLELNHEKKRFLDCIKVFACNVTRTMCRLLLNYYDVKKEILPALSMIVERTGYVKLEGGQLRVRIRGFKNREIDYAARHLCEDLNKMKPVTLDKFRFPIYYEVL